jgi:hypothetical protein
MKLSESSQSFLLKIFNTFEASGIPAIILRNYKCLPREVGSDIDVYVPRKSLISCARTVLDAAKDHGLEVAHLHQRGYFAAYWLRSPGERRFWHVDLYPGATAWHGFEFLDPRKLEETSLSWRLGRIPRPAHEALITLLAGFLWGGRIKDSYYPRIRELLQRNEEYEEFGCCLEKAFGGAADGIAAQLVAKVPPGQFSGNLARRMTGALKRRSYRQHPLDALRRHATHWLAESVCYLVDPPGIKLSIPDGQELPDEDFLLIKGLFGGIKDLRSDNPSLVLRRSQELRARGTNFLLLVTGPEWRFEGCIALKTSPATLFPDLLKVLRHRLSLPRP